MSEKRLPHVEMQLVEYLARLFPNKCPAITDTEREIFASVGAQRVIAKLQQIANSQAGSIPNVLDHLND